MIVKTSVGALMVLFAAVTSEARTVTDFNAAWDFAKDGGTPQRVDLPHDWAVDGGFTLDVSGAEGHLPYPGVGVYRKKFETPRTLTAGGRLRLEIDGAMNHSSVRLNGRHVSPDRPYGYISYAVDLTDALKPAGETNELEIRLDVPPKSTRYYSGAGLFRDVRLVEVAPTHVAYNGVCVRTERTADGGAKVQVSVEVEGNAKAPMVCRIRRRGKVVAAAPFTAPKAELVLAKPDLWSPETPNLYTLEIDLKQNGAVCDSVSTVFGVRTVEFRPGEGFFLNGQHRQMKGVCLHHDFGPLGGAFHRDAARRQLLLMKEMGADAVRTTHNPPDPKFLDLCDELGLMVMDESFDMWELGKNDNDYHLQFVEWHERDLTDFVKRDRNHPCVMLWSIGNEVHEHTENAAAGYRIGTNLTEIVSRYDDRPTTVACWSPVALTNGLQKTVKVFGGNYIPWYYEGFIRDNPDKCIIGSETESVLSSRGVYFYPFPEKPNNTRVGDPQPFYYGRGTDETTGKWGVLTNVFNRIFRDGQVTGYDVACYQADLNHPPDTQFMYQEKTPACCGMFTWTGFDYLGEPTPYYDKGARNRSANFGVMDLCGFPKDRYWLFQSHWRPDVPTAHILPHWNWTAGMEIPVHVYSSGDEAELFVNGKSQGRRAKARYHYRFVWEKVRYEPGEVKVVTWKKGVPWASETVRTTGAFAKVIVEREYVGDTLAYYRLKAVDKDGNVVPTANVPLKLTVSGGMIAGVCNGDPTDWTPFKGDRISTFNGLAQVIVRGPSARLTVTPVNAAVADELAEGFANPPPEAKPHTWWHWMNGNVSKAGITADLEAIAAAGLGGVQLFDAGCEIPPGPVAFNTPAWDEHIKFAAQEARRLGLEIVVPNCSGWSSSGGPWNPASNAMKRVTFVEASVKGGATFAGLLPKPEDKFGFYRDIAVLAIPLVGAERALGEAGAQHELKAQEENVLAFDLVQPFAATALAVAIKPSAWVGQHRALVTVETSDDGQKWANAVDLVLPIAIDSIIVDGVQRLPFGKTVTARHWRLRMAPKVPTSVQTCTVSELALLNRAVIPGYEGKSFALRDQKPYPTHPSTGPALPFDTAVDLTDKLAADGTLKWTAPAGSDWRILRIGYAANGRKNHPASRFGCGFEVDKLSKRALDFHFEAYIGKLCKALGPLAGDHPSGLVGTLVDSYEIGCQNWTQGFEDEFLKRAGYSIVPYLPVLAGGYVVGDAAKTEKFLGDFRQVIAELFTENYAGALQEKCRQYGLKFSLEPYGNCPCDDFEYGYFCDIPMSEFWVGEKNNLGTGNCRIAASIGHVYGRKTIGAESFTAGPSAIGGRWQSDPFSLKVQGDRAYTEGINRFIFHRFTHQPWAKDKTYLPGMTMGQWGTHFDRTNTWWPLAGDFFRYLARCQWLLREGVQVIDAAVYLGDRVPMTITPYDTRYVPNGWDSDVINTRGLKMATPEKGRLVSAGGVSYGLVALPAEPLTRPEAIAAVERLRQAGVPTCPLAELKNHLPPIDFGFSGTTCDVRYVHRRYADGREAYFVAYPDRERGAVLSLSLRVAGKTPQFWDPATGDISEVREWREEKGRTFVTWQADPGGSVFVMFTPSKPGTPKAAKAVAPALRTVPAKTTGWKLTLPGGRSRPLKDALVSWTELEPEFRYFSGTATYTTTLSVPAGVGRVTLDLGKVKNLAVVTVAGRTFPVLWKPPFAVDVTEAVKGCRGKTTSVTVKVTNLWPNRLIGDDFLPPDCEWKKSGGIVELPKWVLEGKPSPTRRSTFTTWKHWTKADKPLPSGLLGPVRLAMELTK